MSGTATARANLAITASGSTSTGGALPSSFAVIAGNCTDGPNTLTFSSNGAMFERSATMGCVINGQSCVTVGGFSEMWLQKPT